MPNFGETPRPHNAEAEIELDQLERGEVRTIEAEISQIRQRALSEGFYMPNVQTYELDPLEEALREGYKYILRLPRVNRAGCVSKYGGHYERQEWYLEFMDTLALRNGISRLKHTTDSYCVLDSKADAELLKKKLIEKQELAELEFEVIDNTQ